MPRPLRTDFPGITQHVVQRAVDRRPCFIHEIHYREYLRNLLAQAELTGCQVHAYVLMCNHIHLLATPQEPGGIGRMMQSISRRYVGFFNLTMDRTGALWESRYDSRRVDGDNYLLRCYRYIELNPVRARIVREAQDFPWSSFRCNALGYPDPLVTPHPTLRSLGLTAVERTTAYRAFVGADGALADADAVRVLGCPKRGRPPKACEDE